jgi:hypothetical protein
LLEPVAWKAGTAGSELIDWKVVYYLLEAEGFDCWLVNAREVKNTPGRAKTSWMRCGWQRWLSAACVARRWFTRRRSGGCAI